MPPAAVVRSRVRAMLDESCPGLIGHASATVTSAITLNERGSGRLPRWRCRVQVETYYADMYDTCDGGFLAAAAAAQPPSFFVFTLTRQHDEPPPASPTALAASDPREGRVQRASPLCAPRAALALPVPQPRRRLGKGGGGTGGSRRVALCWQSRRGAVRRLRRLLVRLEHRAGAAGRRRGRRAAARRRRPAGARAVAPGGGAAPSAHVEWRHFSQRLFPCATTEQIL